MDMSVLSCGTGAPPKRRMLSDFVLIALRFKQLWSMVCLLPWICLGLEPAMVHKRRKAATIILLALFLRAATG